MDITAQLTPDDYRRAAVVVRHLLTGDGQGVRVVLEESAAAGRGAQTPLVWALLAAVGHVIGQDGSTPAQLDRLDELVTASVTAATTTEEDTA